MNRRIIETRFNDRLAELFLFCLLCLGLYWLHRKGVLLITVEVIVGYVVALTVFSILIFLILYVVKRVME